MCLQQIFLVLIHLTVFLLPLFLKDIFTGDGIVLTVLFFQLNFKNVTLLFLSTLCSPVSNGQSFLQLFSRFSSLSLVFSSLDIMCLGKDFSVFLLLGVH